MKNALLLAVGLALSSCGSQETPETDRARDSVTFNMAWLPQGSMSGVLVAIDRGFYEARGLDQGMFDFGYGDPLAVILNRDHGGKAMMVGAINQDWPAALCYVKGRHAITIPADLRGLTVGGGRASPMQALFPAWLERNDVDPDEVVLLQLYPAVVIASLLEGQIDAGECWRANSIPLFEKGAKEAGIEIRWIEYGAFGLDIHGSGLVTSQALVIVKGEGLETLGWLEEEKVARALGLVTEAYGLQAAIAPTDLYTTAFLE